MNSPDKKDRILIFSTAYLPLIGGAELAVKNITDHIPDYEFHLITAKIKSGLPSFEKIGNVYVYRIGFGNIIDKLLLPILGFFKALRLNVKNNYRIVWAIMASYGGFAGLFYKIIKPKVKFLLTLQEGDDLSYIKKRIGIIYPLFAMIFKRADFIQPISNFLALWAKGIGAGCPIEVVPNGVDLEIFKSAWQLKNLQKRIIITVSRLVEKNGVRSLIEAMKDVEGELWIIGDGELRMELGKLVEDLRMNQRIRFFGHLPPAEVFSKLSQASVFVRPSLSEGLGNAYLEAMAVGLPAVGTPIGGIPDFLTDGETGWFCEANNPHSIANKIKHILNPENQQEIKRIIYNARKLVEDKHDWKNISESIKNILNGLMK